MNQQPPSHSDESVTTEPQRIALERMSAELIHNLNVMIAEQEERARLFAEQHHSTSPCRSILLQRNCRSLRPLLLYRSRNR